MESTEDLKGSSGQTLVQVAMLMVVFFALLTIAIDGGHILNERRRMQNAADAGALAGAWEICYGEPGRAESTAREYAIDHNGAQIADVSIGGPRVTVYAREDVGLNIARLFGINTARINARAVAACGAVTRGCGLWPIAFPLWRWEQLQTEGVGCEGGEIFYVWAGHQESKSPDCGIYDCNVDGDEHDVNDIVGFHGRAFLDFGDERDRDDESDCTAPGCGEDELACWIASQEGGHFVIPEGGSVCIPGTTGVKAGLKDEVDSREFDIVGIPIYNDQPCSGPRYCPGGERYNIVEIGCVEVVGWVHQLTLPRLEDDGPPWKGKAIKVKLACGGCETHCGTTAGGPQEPWGMTAVSLIE